MLDQLIAQKADLEAKIAEAQRQVKTGAVDKIKALMAEAGVTLADLGAKQPAAVLARPKASAVAAKYKGPAGETWSGRGLKPRWLTAEIKQGRTLDEFRV